MVRSTPAWLSLIVLLGACAGNQSPATNAPDAAPDLTTVDLVDLAPTEPAAPDVALDAPSLDVPGERAEDTAADRVDVPARCTRGEDCAGNAMGSVCDTATGRCVECVPALDGCPAERHCDAATNRCVPGCRADEGCAGDGGTERRCDVAAHRCVQCVTDAHCGAGSLCVGNACVAGCSATHACPAGQQCCAGACADTLSSLVHCGACDRRCETANGMPACRNGVCAVGSCTEPFADCDRSAANGCETDTRTAVAHCGACAMPCAARARSVARCAAGRCEYTCEEGFADCDGDPMNGCEADTRTDAAHCGGCGRACTPPRATGACMLGRCAVARCEEGFGDCDGNPANGCEVDTRTSVSHCGRCGNACAARPNGFPGCVASRCVVSCVAGFAECNGMDDDGCEADLRSSVRHCGACGRSCATGAGTSANACRLGECTPECARGFGNCDGNPGNGCEANLRTDPRNCGGCGRTGPLQDDPVASTLSQSGMIVAPAFPGALVDDATSSLAFHVDRSTPGAFLRIDLGAGGERSYVRIRLYMHRSEPPHRGVYDIQFSDDDRLWRTARAGFAPAAPEWNETTWPSVGAHRYWRLLLTNTPGAGSWVYELELFTSCELVCAAGTGDCDGNQANGCETRLDVAEHCGACGRRAQELCNGVDDNCNGMIDEGVLGCTASSPGESCADILSRGASHGDGEYWIRVSGAPLQVQCLMSRDGGGWTLVGNFPWPGNTGGVRGWNSAGRVGTIFTNVSRPFKLADAEINALRGNAFRAHGTATRCCCIPGVGRGACRIDTVLFWRASCVYSSSSNSPACSAAFLDPGFTRPSPAGTSPCGHHWGLTSVSCGSTSAMGTSHSGEHVFTGSTTDFTHAYDGRDGEDPTVRFWVR